MTGSRMRVPGSPAQRSSNGAEAEHPAMPAVAAPDAERGETPPDPLAEHPTLVKIRELRRADRGRHYLCWHSGWNRQVHVRLIPRPGQSHDAEGLADQLLDHGMCSSHPHVVSLLDVSIAPRSVAVVTEAVNHSGALADLVSSKAQAAGSTGLSEEQARALMQQLLVAADYCHRLGIALYNMRLDNVLLSGCPDSPVVRLYDFGTSFSAPCEGGGDGVGDTPAAPFLHYLGPEFIFNDRELGMEADVYSCGVILYALLSGGRFPFKRCGEEAMSSGLRMNKEKWRAVAGHIAPLPQASPACWHLVKAMLRSEIGDRPNVAEVLRHPWMQVDMPAELAAVNDRLMQQQDGGSGAAVSRGPLAEVITASILDGDCGAAFSIRAS